MAKNIHVLPVGFETWRLLEPIRIASGQVSEIVLVSPPEEADEAIEREVDGRRGFVSRMKRNLRSELESESVTEETMPPLHSYTQVYEWAHRYLGELAEEGIVHVNISSLPTAAAIAVSQAVTTLKNDRPALRGRLDAQYLPVERYLGVEAYDALRAESRNQAELFRSYQQYQEVHPDLFRAVVEPIEEKIQRLDSWFSERLDEMVGEEMSREGTREQLVECRRRLDEASESFERAKRGEEGREDEWEPAFSPYEVDPETPVESLCKRVEELPPNAFHAQSLEKVRAETDELRRLVARFTSIQEKMGNLESALEDSAGESQLRAVREEMERHGMTRGRVRSDGEIVHLSVPVPPAHDVSAMETAILFTLARTEAVGSINELGDRLTVELISVLEQQLDTAEPVETLDEGARGYVEQLIEEDGRSEVLERVEMEIHDVIRSRLQYNLEKLEEKGYIRRREADHDRRRKELLLSQTGRLWVGTHDYAESGLSAIGELLTKELQKLQD